MEKFSDFLIPMAFPNWRIYLPDQWYRPILHGLGYNKDNTTSLGHSLILLINGITGDVEYSDFGRYCVPPGLSRARLSIEDPLLKVPIKAKIKGTEIININELMNWVYDAKHIHHSGGPLLYKVLPHCSFNKAYSFGLSMIERGFVEYNIFGKQKSNCSRYVRDVIMSSLDPTKVDFGYKYGVLTPTPVDNVFFNFRKNGYWTLEQNQHVHHVHKPLDHILFYNGKRKIVEKTKPIQPSLPNKQFVDCNGVGAYYEFEILNASRIALVKYDTEGTYEWKRYYKLKNGTLDSKKDLEINFGNSLHEYDFFENGKKIASVIKEDLA